MTVFVDTSAVLALLWASDARHAAAVAAWRTLLARRASFVTTDLVLAETVAVTRSRAGFEISVKAGERLQRTPFDLVWADRDLVDEAWVLYKKYRDHVLSLCDCVSFALMRQRRIDRAFAFDGDFEKVGFETVRAD